MIVAVDQTQLNELLRAHAFTERHGFEVVAVADGECRMAVPYRSDFDRPGGIVSGQVVMHAADVAFWLAIKTRLGLDDASVTSSMTTAFLGGLRQEGFLCHAQVLKVGRRLVYGQATCTAGDRPVAHHTLTYARAG